MSPRPLAVTLLVLALAVPLALARAGPVISDLPLAACPAGLATPFGATDAGCPGIRPGAPLTGPSGSGVFCTLAWALQDASGTVYMTTAGHCVSVGERVGTEGVGAFGTVVARMCGPTPLLETCEPGYDWGLIQVDASKAAGVSNDLCGWGTPSRVFTEHDLVPRRLYHHGYGIATSSVAALRAREGVTSILDDSRKFGFEGVVSPGDSGSAAMVQPDALTTDYAAIGIITHLTAYTEADPDPVRDGTGTGTRLDAAMGDMDAALGITLHLL